MSNQSAIRTIRTGLSPRRVWELVSATVRWLTFDTRLGAGLLLLTMVNLIAGIVLFRGLQPAQGVMSYGDLPGIYTYPPLNWGWVQGAAFYPLANQLAARTLGNAI